MNKIQLGLRLFAISGIFLILNACNGGETTNKIVTDHDNTNHTEMITKAICVMTPTEGNDVKGLITFTQTDGGILIEADIEGLYEGNHGFHIHEWGDISKSDGTAAGGHFNPDGSDHAGPADAVRHAGDLGNITAGADGKAHYNQVDSLISFTGKHNIIGRSVIVHVGEDDLVSQPTGDAGGRVAQGVIGVGE